MNTVALPLGRRLDLPGRGTTFIREVPGPPGAPVVVLLHGLVASGGLNWFPFFRPLGAHYRVIAVDLRGHGRGLRSNRRFRLADCADDLSATLDVLEIPSAVFVGYSMGGPVAQLMWRRHRDQVDGLVMSATSDRFVPGRREQLVLVTAMTALAGTTRIGGLLAWAPVGVVRRIGGSAVRPRPETMRLWARAEMQRHDWRSVAEAAQALGNYDASHWIGEVDVPTAVIVTELDQAIPATDQRRMAASIRLARVIEVADGHLACARPSFARPLLAACAHVTRRIEPARPRTASHRARR